MLTTLVLNLLITTAFAATPCCIDRQFEAVMGELGGLLYSVQGKPTSTLIDSTNVIHYDFYNKMMATEATSVVNGKSARSDIIINLATNDMYVTTSGHCTKSKNTFNTPFIEPCIPDDAKAVSSTYLGYGLNAINITTWQFKVKGVDDVIRLAVTDKGCIPIAESAYGTIGQYSSDIVFIVTNFNPGIRKQHVFDIPSHCSESPHDYPEHLRRVIRAMEKIATFR